MQGAEDLGQPLQVAVERRGRILGPRRAGKACRDEDESGQKMLGHEARDDMPFQCAGSKARQRKAKISGPEQAPGRLDDLLQAAGELEIAEARPARAI